MSARAGRVTRWRTPAKCCEPSSPPTTGARATGCYHWAPSHSTNAGEPSETNTGEPGETSANEPSETNGGAAKGEPGEASGSESGERAPVAQGHLERLTPC